MGIPWKWNRSNGGWRSSGDLSPPPNTAFEGREGENLRLYSEAVMFPPTVVGMEWRGFCRRSGHVWGDGAGRLKEGPGGDI